MHLGKETARFVRGFFKLDSSTRERIKRMLVDDVRNRSCHPVQRVIGDRCHKTQTFRQSSAPAKD